MKKIQYINRATGQIEQEEVFGGHALKFLYGKSTWTKIFGRPLCFLVSRIPLFSYLFGWWHQRPFTKKKIQPFIQQFRVNVSEFLEPVDYYQTFNDFFIRKLKSESRPIATGKNIAVMPADGRYLFFQNISKSDGFVVKGEKFNLSTLLQDSELAAKYENGAMIMARLCPVDYHRYHFPIDCKPGKTQMINGALYSVNPWAIAQDISIFTKNRRTICKLESELFGTVIFMEIGATCVGSIHETYTPGIEVSKGAEKGYFSLGASSLILLFLPGRLTIDQDLIANSNNQVETLCLMGQRFGIRL